MVVARKIAVYKQLCEALHIIAAHDWPAEWESLIPVCMRKSLTAVGMCGAMF